MRPAGGADAAPDDSVDGRQFEYEDEDDDYDIEDLEEDPDWVRDKLIAMGFDVSVALAAVHEAMRQQQQEELETQQPQQPQLAQQQPTPSDADDQQPVSLLESALFVAFLSSLEDPEEPRSVRFQAPTLPTRSTPMHRTLRPTRGIMREPATFPEANKFKALFKKEWFDKAVGSLGLGSSKKNTPSSNAGGGSGFTSLFSKSPPTTGSPGTLKREPVRSGSTHSFSDHQSATIAHSTSTAGQHAEQVTSPPAKRRVRFQFPDITIPHESAATATFQPSGSTPGVAVVGPPGDDAGALGAATERPDAAQQASPSASASEAPVQTAVSQAPSEDGQTSTSQEAVQTRRSAPAVVVRQPTEFTPSELHNYYMQLLQTDDRSPVPSLANLLREGVERNAFPKAIDLSGVMITASNAPPLAELLTIDFGLESINLENCALTDELLKMLLQSLLCLTSLSWVSLANNSKIQAQGVKYIAVFLKKSKSIRHMDISGIPLDSQGVQYINHALSAESERGFRQSALESLKMDGVKLKSSHLEILYKGIRRSRLMYLSMRHNALTSSAGKHLGRILQHKDSPPPAAGDPSDDQPKIPANSCLMLLDLRDNHIGPGVADLADVLTNNRSLEKLSLRANRIDGAGFVAVATSLLRNTKIKTLDMSGNRIFTPGDLAPLESLRQLILNSSTLTSLLLSNTNMSTEDAIALAEVLPLSKVIQKLDFSYNIIGAAGVMSLAAIMNTCPRITKMEVFPMLTTLSDELNEASARSAAHFDTTTAAAAAAAPAAAAAAAEL
ncbi:hypothetical protein HK105_206972 [Polyrhizophydium stewartii]|uniref:RNI-like protein n=1 Tax=Polyrhizophydium stewartii TaxID=2732419 RepID=A0ABR4N1V2_9FUNG